MAKTLVDMTAEERADCVGMWCDNLVSTAGNPKPVVLACVQGERCWILHTNLHGEWSCFPLGSVSPRPDLPRVWTPDGEPELAQALAEETYEYSYQVKHADGWETACNDVTHVDEWWPDKHVAAWAAHAAYDPYIDRPIRLVRRRVSPPEVME